MATPIAPGIYTSIIDESQYVATIGGTTGFFSIVSPAGEDNKLIYVSSQSQLINSFGQPNLSLYGQSLYNAFNFLTYSGNEYVLKPLPTIEDTASAIANGEVVPATPTYPWTDKPATFAGTVFGFFTATNLNTSHTTYNSTLILGTSTATSLTIPSSGLVTITGFSYIVGSNSLQVYLNGNLLTINQQYQEVGSFGSTSSQILMLVPVEQTDVISFFLLNANLLQSFNAKIENPFTYFLPQAMQPSFYSTTNVLATSNSFTGTFVEAT
ncbi:MAG: hypothetical protein QXI16_03395, partial [Sulfolobaceae archaeon]